VIERDVLPGWARTGCLAACILLGLGITGCRTAPLGDGATNSDAGVAARIERAGERTDLEESLDPTWIPTRADYDRRGTSGSPWIATAEPAPKGGGASGGGGGDLAKQAQNPIASLISLPLQNNTSFGIGPEDRTQNVLNFQPVYPVTLGKGWTLVNRAIIPIVHQPDVTSTSRAWDGLGDINLTSFVVAPPMGNVMIGAGPVVLFPTASDSHLGARQWGLGPSAIVVVTPGKWVLGALVNNVWSLDGGDDATNSFLAQYFVNYNLPQQWYLTTAPIITADWNAPSDDRWIVPFGGGVGKIFKIGKQPFNASVQAYYHAVKPDGGADWSLRVQLTALFPK